MRVNEGPLVLWLLWPICAACGASEVDGGRPARHAVVADLFAIDDAVELVGTEAAPLYTRVPPLLHGGRIYVADDVGHRLYVFDDTGSLVRTVGDKGSDPLQFELPYNIVADGRGQLYVNDRGNGRIQVLDAELGHVRTFAAPGQNEQLLVIEEEGRVDMLVQGVAGCEIAPRCLLTRYGPDGRMVDAFAPAWRVPVSTWVAGLADGGGGILLANVVGDTVASYSLAGRARGGFRLQSPSIRPFVAEWRPSSAAELNSTLARLRHDSYTLIRSLTVLGRNVLVQFQRMNWPEPAGEFVLDVYSWDGRLLVHGVETPGVLQRSGDGLYFVEHSDAEYGSITIRRAHYLDADGIE